MYVHVYHTQQCFKNVIWAYKASLHSSLWPDVLIFFDGIIYDEFMMACMYTCIKRLMGNLIL